MGDGFITRRGGGSGKPLSAISVEYPIGSVCTATNGETTLTAPDTEGKVIFNVEPGTWTVKAEDEAAGKSKTASVTVAVEGEVHEVKLTYELILFDAGSYAPETGGWSGISGKVLKSSTSCNNMDGVYQWTCQTANAVDLSDYSTLYVTVSSLSKSYYFTCRFGVGTSKTSHTSYVNLTSTSTFSLDISSRNTSLYLSLYHGGAANQNGATDGNTTVQISKVWLV